MAAGSALVNDPEESRGELQCLLRPVSGTTVPFATFFFPLVANCRVYPHSRGRGMELCFWKKRVLKEMEVEERQSEALQTRCTGWILTTGHCIGYWPVSLWNNSGTSCRRFSCYSQGGSEAAEQQRS